MDVGYEDEISLQQAGASKCCFCLEIKQRIFSIKEEVTTLKRINTKRRNKIEGRRKWYQNPTKPNQVNGNAVLKIESKNNL